MGLISLRKMTDRGMEKEESLLDWFSLYLKVYLLNCMKHSYLHGCSCVFYTLSAE